MKLNKADKMLFFAPSNDDYVEVLSRPGFKPDVEPVPNNPYNIKPLQGVPKYDEKRGMFYYGTSLDELNKSQRFFSPLPLRCAQLVLVIAIFYYLYNMFIDRPSLECNLYGNKK